MFISISERDLEALKRDLIKTKPAAFADGTNKKIKITTEIICAVLYTFQSDPNAMQLRYYCIVRSIFGLIV